jgi:hypothetical protein
VSRVKRLGGAAFAFFFLKGLVWVAVVALAPRLI